MIEISIDRMGLLHGAASKAVLAAHDGIHSLGVANGLLLAVSILDGTEYSLLRPSPQMLADAGRGRVHWAWLPILAASGIIVGILAAGGFSV